MKKKLDDGISASATEITAVKKQNQKLQAEVAVRQAKAELNLAWERKTSALKAEVQTLCEHKTNLEAEVEDVENLKAEYKVLELKVKKSGLENMEIAKAENRILQLKLERAERTAKERDEDESRERKKVKVE